jgi:hypothetical protein
MFRENTQHAQQSFLDSTASIAGRLKDRFEKSWSPLFYEHIFSQIDESPFSVPCSSTGAPNATVNVMLSLEIIKHMFDITDEDLMDRFCFDYQVGYAVGRREFAADGSICERTIYYFREKLYIYTMEHPEAEDLMFGQFKGLLKHFCEKTGQIMDEQRCDATMFMSSIKKSGRISLACDALAKGVRAIPAELLTESLLPVLGSEFKKEMLYKPKSEQSEGRLNQTRKCCAEALEVLNCLPDGAAQNERRILARLLGE